MSAPPIRAPILIRLAARDLTHGWQATSCLVVAVAVALIPLLILYGLKLGVVTNLFDTLRSDPRIREIRLLRDLPLSREFMEELRQDQRVAFLLPRARHLAASLMIRGPGDGGLLDVRMIPTTAGDPFLADISIPTGFDEVVLTERVAIESAASTNDMITLTVLRTVNDERQVERRAARVVGVIARDVLQTDDVFVSPDLEGAIERWREGFAVPELDWEGAGGRLETDAEARQFASFRLFAADLRDVPGLRDRLLRDGLDVDTRASEIERTLVIETGLRWVFVTVTGLSAAGFLLTLGLHLAASVVEKARELSVLRLLGLRSSELALMPSIQGLMIATSGAVIACLVAVVAQPIVNSSLAGLAGLEGNVSRLETMHIVIAILITALVGAIAGSVAGLRAATLEPTRGLRHD